MSIKTAEVGKQYFKPAIRPRTQIPRLAKDFDESALWLKKLDPKVEVIFAYAGVQTFTFHYNLELGEATYSLGSAQGMSLAFPTSVAFIRLDEVDMIIDTALGVFPVDSRSCESCERELPVIFKDHRLERHILKDYFIVCPNCMILRPIRERIVIDVRLM